MISRIRDNIIYTDPSLEVTRYEAERKRHLHASMKQQREGIPSTSGPVPVIYGRHQLTEEDTTTPEKKKIPKKRIKGVWYPPNTEDEEGNLFSHEQIDMIYLNTQEEVLTSLKDPRYVWDVDSKKGVKSREHFREYVKRLGIAWWRAKKKEEEETFVGSITAGNNHPPKKDSSTRSVASNVKSGPKNSANTIIRH
jgi:hypothetical protein